MQNALRFIKSLVNGEFKEMKNGFQKTPLFWKWGFCGVGGEGMWLGGVGIQLFLEEFL
jgi:hypothetical protein